MRFPVVAALACQQYLLVSLIYAAIPVVLRRDGAPLEVIGLFGMVFFAFTVNFLWAPLVDRHPLTRLGRRRSWLLATQAAGALAIAALAFLDPARDHAAILALCVLLATAAATQRIVTLGYVAEVLADHERSLGAAVVGWGGALGNVIGGAICLHLVEAIGWRPALLAIGAAILAFAAGLVAIAEPRPAAAAAVRQPVLRFLARREAWRAIGVIAPATLGVAIAFAMVQPRLADLGYGLADIGTTIAATHLLAFTAIGPVAGLAARRVAPARGIAQGGIVLGAGFAALAFADGWLGPAAGALAAVVFVFCALAAQNVAFTGFFFSLARPSEEASDVAVLLAAMSALALVGFAASGFVAAVFGYAATLIVAAAGYGLTALLAARLRQ